MELSCCDGSLFTFLYYKKHAAQIILPWWFKFLGCLPKFLLSSCFNSYTSCLLTLLMQRFVLPAQNLLLYSFKPYGLLNTCSVFEKLWVQPAVLHWFVLPAQNLVFYSFYSNHLWLIFFKKSVLLHFLLFSDHTISWGVASIILRISPRLDGDGISPPSSRVP